MQIQMEYPHYPLALLIQLIIRRLMLGVADEVIVHLNEVIVHQNDAKNVSKNANLL